MMTPATPSTPPIPHPSDWPAFRAEVEQARGRPLLLAPADLPPGHSSFWVATSDVDLIAYARDGDEVQQLRDIAHQAAHLLLGHQPVPDGAGHLFPHLDPAAVSAVLTVARYSRADEATAGEFASRVVIRGLAAGRSGEPQP